MRTHRTLATFRNAVLCAVLVWTSATVHATGTTNDSQDCLPGIAKSLKRNPTYGRLFAILAPRKADIRSLLDEVSSQATYAALLAEADSIASGIADGRVVVTLPDGTVVLDTSRPDDPANVLPTGNSYQHFLAKTVNENHNSRVAIFAAQLYPCGLGLESKLSTSTGAVESYVALRLGVHLNNSGTARLSTIQ